MCHHGALAPLKRRSVCRRLGAQPPQRRCNLRGGAAPPSAKCAQRGTRLTPPQFRGVQAASALSLRPCRLNVLVRLRAPSTCSVEAAAPRSASAPPGCQWLSASTSTRTRWNASSRIIHQLPRCWLTCTTTRPCFAASAPCHSSTLSPSARRAPPFPPPANEHRNVRFLQSPVCEQRALCLPKPPPPPP